MASEKDLEKKLEKIIQDLNPEELKQLIQKLTEDYYLSYFSNNVDVNEAVYFNLKRIAKQYSEDFNVKEYINYCLLLAVNKFLVKYVPNDVKLKAVEVDLVKKEVNTEVYSRYTPEEKLKKIEELKKRMEKMEYD